MSILSHFKEFYDGNYPVDLYRSHQHVTLPTEELNESADKIQQEREKALKIARMLRIIKIIASIIIPFIPLIVLFVSIHRAHVRDKKLHEISYRFRSLNLPINLNKEKTINCSACIRAILINMM